MAKISRTRIATVIADKIDAGTLSASDLSKEVAAYLLDARRSGELDSLLRDVMRVRAERGTLEVLAHTAYPLSDMVRTDIENQVKTLFPNTARIIISEVHDPDVVGGVRLEFADQQLDLSVRAKLNEFKQLTTAN